MFGPNDFNHLTSRAASVGEVGVMARPGVDVRRLRPGQVLMLPVGPAETKGRSGK
jgi:hypothetical protein